MKEKFQELKEWLGESNHWKHVFACFFVALLTISIADLMHLNWIQSMVFSLTNVISVGLTAEYKDSVSNGVFSYHDLVADIIGGLAGIVGYSLFAIPFSLFA